jgi:hypothetical protein
MSYSNNNRGGNNKQHHQQHHQQQPQQQQGAPPPMPMQQPQFTYGYVSIIFPFNSTSGSQLLVVWISLQRAPSLRERTLADLFSSFYRKVLFCFAQGYGYSNLGEADPEGNTLSSDFLLFPEKEAKSVVLLRRRLWYRNLVA